MTTKTIFQILLLLILCQSMIGQRMFGTSRYSSSFHRRLFLTFSNQLSRETVRFLHAHSCEVHLTPKIQDESMARWRHIVLRCRDLAYNDISSVICHKSCFDPVSCERVDHLKGVPVLWGRAIIDSQRKKHRIDLPVACKCIAKTKKPEAQC